jgi:hypothetical protein
MTFSAIIAVDPNAVLPPGSLIRMSASGFFDHSFAVTSPGTFDNWLHTASLPASFAIEVDVFVGDLSPIRLEAGNQADRSRISFLVLPGTQQEPRFLFAGDITHPSRQAAAVCQVTCLSDGKTAGPGACVECENEAAIVKLCC